MKIDGLVGSMPMIIWFSGFNPIPKYRIRHWDGIKLSDTLFRPWRFYTCRWRFGKEPMRETGGLLQLSFFNGLFEKSLI